MIAPAGWSLRPVETHVARFDDDVTHRGASRIDCPDCHTQERAIPLASAEVAVPAEHCGKRFRTPAGFAWHLQNVHAEAAASPGMSGARTHRGLTPRSARLGQ